jgi:aminocarboxymuconate-semialdehyde decarboxylase
MINRRNFLLGTAIAGSSLTFAAGRLAFQSAFAADAAPRKTVFVGGKRAKVVDIHAHAVIPAVKDVVKGTSLDRDVARNQILGPQRLQAMDARGIDVQVLSINIYWWYAAERELAANIVRTHDEGLAEWCKTHSDRFVPLTSVALQFPDLAAEQLEYAVKKLGFRGASIGGHVNGEVPSGEKYNAFWAKAEELGVAVFMHPGGARNLTRENAWEGRGDLGNIIGDPLETAVFLTKLIFDGTLDRFPNLKVVGAHAGGYLPSYLSRVDVACEYRANANCANKKKPSEYLKTQIMADSMIFSEEGVRHLVAEMGAGQVVYGSDMPFNWPDTIEIIAASPNLNDEQKLAILGGNLVKLLKIAA